MITLRPKRVIIYTRRVNTFGDILQVLTQHKGLGRTVVKITVGGMGC